MYQRAKECPCHYAPSNPEPADSASVGLDGFFCLGGDSDIKACPISFSCYCLLPSLLLCLLVVCDLGTSLGAKAKLFI